MMIPIPRPIGRLSNGRTPTGLLLSGLLLTGLLPAATFAPPAAAATPADSTKAGAASQPAAAAAPAVTSQPAVKSDPGPATVSGVTREEVTLRSGTETIRAHVSRPGGKGPWPGIVVAHEWWGLNEQIRGVADRLAGAGYVVIVPDLYHGPVTEDAEKAHELLRGLPDERGVADLSAGAAWLGASRLVSGKPVGILGFCMGGGLALRTSMSLPLRACVSFYGLPRFGPDDLARAQAPILGFYGADDQGIPLEGVRSFEAELKKLGKPVEIQVVEGAGHAFMNETRPGYRAAQAAEAWTRLLAFLSANLAG